MNPIIKAVPDTDLYMEWSSIVDAPTFIGTREETLAHLNAFQDGKADPPSVRLARADQTGTSAVRRPGDRDRGPLFGSWEDTGVIVDQLGWLPRDRFAKFMKLYQAGSKKAYDLLDPFDDV